MTAVTSKANVRQTADVEYKTHGGQTAAHLTNFSQNPDDLYKVRNSITYIHLFKNPIHFIQPRLYPNIDKADTQPITSRPCYHGEDREQDSCVMHEMSAKQIMIAAMSR